LGKTIALKHSSSDGLEMVSILFLFQKGSTILNLVFANNNDGLIVKLVKIAFLLNKKEFV